MIERIENDNGTSLVLTPNRSLSWQGNLILWCAFTVLVLVIATGMALAGAWVVLPFAGLELLGLLAGLYYTSRQCHQQEVLHITPETVRLEKGLYQKECEWEMPRQWVRLYLTMPIRGWKPPQTPTGSPGIPR
jgi:Integral membrane protein